MREAWYKHLTSKHLNGLYAKAIRNDGSVIYGQFDEDGRLDTNTGMIKVLFRYSDFPWQLNSSNGIVEVIKELDPYDWSFVPWDKLSALKPGFDYVVIINKRVYPVTCFNKDDRYFTVMVDGSSEQMSCGLVDGVYERHDSDGLYMDRYKSIWSVADGGCKFLAGVNVGLFHELEVYDGMSYKRLVELVGPLAMLSDQHVEYDLFEL